jgi:hypothetical protein
MPMEPGWEGRITKAVQDLAADMNRRGLDGQYILQQSTIDPGETPQSIAQDLDRIIGQMGGADAIKSRFNTNQVNAGDRFITRTNSGAIVGVDQVNVSPNTIANNRTSIATAGISAETQKRGQDISADTQKRGQDLTAGTAARAAGVVPTVVSIREVK